MSNLIQDLYAEVTRLEADIYASRKRESKVLEIATSAIKTRARDINDWCDDMQRIADLVGRVKHD